jgi:hypothetical protein
MIFPMILLKNHIPIAEGSMRLVYAHPQDPRLVIKVIRPEVIDERWGSGQAWYKVGRRFRQYISFMRETAEYVAMYATYGQSLSFAQKIVGFAETDLGLGLVVAAALDQDGNLAPSLSTLLSQHKFTARIAEDLETFIEQMMASDIVVADLHGANIVYAYTEQHGDHFVMIDGLGLANILPLKALFVRLNRRSKLRHVARLRRRMSS